MVSTSRRFGIALLMSAVLAFGLMGAGSLLGMTGCAKHADVATAPAPEVETEQHKALRATAGFAAGLSTLQDVAEKLYDSKLLGKDEATAFAKGINDATYVNDEATAKISAFATIDGSNREIVVKYMREISDSVKALHEKGVTHVKDPVARERFRLAFQAFDAAMALAESFQD